MPQHEGQRRHWSPSNPVPTITRFLQNLDERRRFRTHREGMQVRPEEDDDEVNEQRPQTAPSPSSQQQEATPDKSQQDPSQGGGGGDEEGKPHTRMQMRTVGRKVIDPTTGREVEIDDVNKAFMEAVKKPTVRIQTCLTDSSLRFEAQAP